MTFDNRTSSGSRRGRRRGGTVESSHIEERDAAVAQSSLQTFYRDPADVRTILSMAWTGTLLVLLLLASVAFNIWQYWRRPDRIVVDRSSGRVLMINDREYGETEAVKLGPDKLTGADKQYPRGRIRQGYLSGRSRHPPPRHRTGAANDGS